MKIMIVSYRGYKLLSITDVSWKSNGFIQKKDQWLSGVQFK